MDEQNFSKVECQYYDSYKMEQIKWKCASDVTTTPLISYSSSTSSHKYSFLHSAPQNKMAPNRKWTYFNGPLPTLHFPPEKHPQRNITLLNNLPPLHFPHNRSSLAPSLRLLIHQTLAKSYRLTKINAQQ